MKTLGRRTILMTNNGQFSQPYLNCVQQFNVLKWFGDIIVRPHFHALSEITPFRFCGEENKRNVFCCGVLSKQVKDPISIQFRHHNVANNDSGPFFYRQFYAALSIFSSESLVPGEVED